MIPLMKGGDSMFQYKLTFALANNRLPTEMDRLLVSFLKSSAQAYSQHFYEKLYDKRRTVIKGYTYSYYLPGAKFHKDGIELAGQEFCLFFSDFDQMELLSFFNGFQQMKYKEYPIAGNSMRLTSIRMQQLHEMKEEEIVIRMQSPLIVRQHDSESNRDIYYTCGMDGFEKTLKENTDFFIEKMSLPVSTEKFSIEVIKGKKVVVPVFGRNTDASLGIFRLTGSRQLLNILLLSGLGSRRSEGHGKFEVVG